MLKIVDRFGEPVVLVGTATDKYRVRAHDLGNGHLEVSASRVIRWEEADWSPEYLQDVRECISKAHEEADPEEVRAKNLARASRRARTRIRRLCKAMGADTLLTLTYRAEQRDLALAKRHTKEFVRRVARVHPGFACVVGFEEQQRKTWHMHFAVAGIPPYYVHKGCVVRSYDLLRSIWRSVVGDLSGNVDVARRRRHRDKSGARIAGYISKYITKAFAEGEKWSNRWTHYGACDVPVPVDLGEVSNLADALSDAFALVEEWQQVATFRLDRWKEWAFLAVERPPSRRSR
ncbi:rolling circle replication-associated protein [Ramlibacter humi]|uniref:Replication-associated protein ORF2/G2P domain-containing protein n=1 Tax=Ramlibacter humi TaxID=2530451 RepID=A0A4Z0BM47_9BURK|nr:hypothetical protein [Ramlibacter humi]TFY99008.1 hypothetical protein EZ216_15710 [Ramlibacter humi]